MATKSKRQRLGPNQLKWLKALESGKYRRTTGVLNRRGAYCCLGVACKVLGIPSEQWADGETFLPDSAISALAMFSQYGDAASDEEKDCCVTMNDELKMSFKQIAKRIRSDPAEYFKRPR